MTVLVPGPDRRQIAAERAERIRNGLQAAAHEYAVAVAERDWEALGYPGVQEWADAELGRRRWQPEARQEIAEFLDHQGFAFREIAKAVGVSPATVSNDLAGGPGVQELNTSKRKQAARDREKKRRGISYRDDETPAIPVWTVQADGRLLLRALRDVALFASRDKGSDLAVVRLRADGDLLRAEATDRYAAAQEIVPCDGEAEVFITAADAQRVAAMLAEGLPDRPASVVGALAGFTVTGDTVTFGGTFGMLVVPICRPERAGLFGRISTFTSSGHVVTVRAAYLARVAKAAGGGSDDPIRLHVPGGGKPVVAEAGTFRAVIQPRRDWPEEGAEPAAPETPEV